MRVVGQDIIVPPQDGFWFKPKFLGDPENGVALLDFVRDHFGAWAGWDGSVDQDQAGYP